MIKTPTKKKKKTTMITTMDTKKAMNIIKIINDSMNFRIQISRVESMDWCHEGVIVVE